jgi:phage terminase small subunit
MLKKYMKKGWVPLLAVVLSSNAYAHCDTLDGPIINDARTAIEKKDIAPVLKWLKDKHSEEEVRHAFKSAMKVRGKDADVEEIADHYFFETLVRVHRTGEGAPYTGLKASGNVAPAILAADKALKKGSVDKLAKKIGHAVETAIKKRFEEAKKKRAHKDENVKDGREYVEAYVGYVHFVEGIHNMVSGAGGHDHGKSKSHDKH